VPEKYFTAAESSWIRTQVLAGRYRISEHILRFMTTGLLTLEQIEAALSHGQVVEVRRNQRGDDSCLVRGTAKAGSLALVCTRSGDDMLVILLAHVSSPAWHQFDDIQPVKGDDMPDTLHSCFFCGGKVTPIVVGNFDYRLEGQLYVIKNVPAGLCVECGEKYITAEAAKKINTMVQSGAFSATEAVHVANYE
jgi:YgiT-type zinc finger domain-containing protein